MTKFFLNSPSNKKRPTDYRMIIFRSLNNLLRAQHLLRCQKTIRKIKHCPTTNNKLLIQLEQQLHELKTITKSELKSATLNIMTKYIKIPLNTTFFTKIGCAENEMIVAAVVDDKMDIGMKPVLNEGNETDNVINTILNNFLNEVYETPTYKAVLEKAFALYETILGKKNERREKRKLSKLLKKNKPRIVPENIEEGQNIEPINDPEAKQVPNNPKKASIKESISSRPNPPKNHYNTQQGYNYTKKTNQSSSPTPRPMPLNRYTDPKYLHPSWEAKRKLKNQMFIQPFEGKHIFL